MGGDLRRVLHVAVISFNSSRPHLRPFILLLLPGNSFFFDSQVNVPVVMQSSLLSTLCY